MKMKKLLAILLMVATLIGIVSAPSFAEDFSGYSVTYIANEGIAPCLNNGTSSRATFSISSTGVASLNNSYTGIPGVTTKVKSNMYIQKKTLGVFWTKVDIGTSDNEWNDTSTTVNGTFRHTFQLTSKGTYRALFTLTFIGTGGSDDKVSEKIVDEYT